MADRIKGITVEINGDTTKLQSALKAVNGSLRESKTALNDVNKLLKMDPGNVTLLKQKQELLTKSIADTKSKLDQEKEALKQLGQGEQTDKVVKQQQALEREIADTENQLKSLEREYKNFGSVAAQQAKAAGEKMQEVGAKITDVGAGIATVGAGMTAAITAPLVSLGKDSVENFGNVEKTLKLVQQTMGQTDAEAVKMSNAIKDAAANSVFSMQDAADAALAFARQGYDTNQIISLLAPTMNLAAGTQTDLAETAEGLGNTYKVFKGEIKDVTELTDMFAQASSQANTDVPKLFDAMAKAAPVMQVTGWSVKDLMAITGVMGDNFIEGAEGANALKTSLLRLSSNKKALEWLDDHDVKIFDEATGKMDDMLTLQKKLQDATKDLTQEEQLQAMAMLFGANQAAKMQAFVNTDSEALTKLRKNLDDTTITAENMANALMEGTGGAMESLQSSWDVTKYNIGEQLGEQLVPLIQELTQLLDTFNSLDDAQKEQIIKAAEVIAAIGPIIAIIGTLIMFIGGVISGIGTISAAIPGITAAIAGAKAAILGVGGAIGTLAGPIALLIGALAFMVMRIEECGITWEDVWDGIGFLIEDGKKLVISLKDKVVETFTNIVTAVEEKIEAVKNTVTSIKDKLSETFTKMIDDAKQWGMDIITGLVDGIMAKINAVKDAAMKVADKIKEYIHFSKPDKGPLSDFDTYMPDMMKELATGINANIGLLDKPMNNLASAMIPANGMGDKLDGIAGAIGNMNTNVNVTLEGDAQGLFKMVKSQNSKAKRMTGRSAFA